MPEGHHIILVEREQIPYPSNFGKTGGQRCFTESTNIPTLSLFLEVYFINLLKNLENCELKPKFMHWTFQWADGWDEKNEHFETPKESFYFIFKV